MELKSVFAVIGALATLGAVCVAMAVLTGKCIKFGMGSEQPAQRPHRLKCAWHPKFFKTEKWLGPDPGGNYAVSHGICAECRDLQAKEDELS